jgi:hypothetical protein
VPLPFGEIGTDAFEDLVEHTHGVTVVSLSRNMLRHRC